MYNRQLTKIQALERGKRKANATRGLRQPKGTSPYRFEPVTQPVFKPMPQRGLMWNLPDLGAIITSLIAYRLRGRNREG